jgi:hypothetical protein
MTSFKGVFMTNSEDGTDPVTLSMYTSGTLASPSIWFGIYGVWADGSKGWYDLYKDFAAERKVEATQSSKLVLNARSMPVYKADASKLERAYVRR